MADDLSVEAFRAARSQVDATARWHLIVLAVLLYFHVAIIAPYGAKSVEKLALARDIEQQRATQAAVAPVSELARDLADTVRLKAGDVAGTLLDQLVGKFAQLNGIVLALTMMRPDDAGDEPGRALFLDAQLQSRTAPPVQMQMPQMHQTPVSNMAAIPNLSNAPMVQATPNMPAISPPQADLSLPPPGAWTGAGGFEPMEPELRRQIAAMGQPGGGPDFTAGLESYIDRAIVQPSFARADSAWRERHLPAIEARADTALGAIDAAMTSEGAAAGALREVAQSIGALIAQARELSFAAPPDQGWWRTVAGKASSIDAMMNDLAFGVDGAAASQLNLDAFLDAVAATVRDQETLAEAVAAEIDELERQSKELQAQLGELGTPLKVISFSLSVLAPLLPLLIAGATCILSLATAEALRRMCVAVALTDDPDRRNRMRPWLAEAAGRGPARVTVRAIVIGAAMGAWILATLPTLRALDPLFLPHAATAAIALAVLAASRLWLWRQATAALAMARARD